MVTDQKDPKNVGSHFESSKGTKMVKMGTRYQNKWGISIKGRGCPTHNIFFLQIFSGFFLDQISNFAEVFFFGRFFPSFFPSFLRLVDPVKLHQGHYEFCVTWTAVGGSFFG